MKLFFSFLSLFLVLSAEIIEVDDLATVESYIKKDSWLLLDVDETLIEFPCALGNKQWRDEAKFFLKKRNLEGQFDLLYYEIAIRVPVISVQLETPEIIKNFQAKSDFVWGFTARGANEWCTTHIEGIDLLTEDQLASVDIHLSKILYTSHVKKGEFLKNALNEWKIRPALIVVVDDKKDQVASVEKAMKEMDIPFIGIWYRRTEKNNKNQLPLIGHYQMDQVFLHDRILSDDEALKELSPLNNETYFNEIFDQISL